MHRQKFTGTKADYLINQMHYHHQNPYRAGLVKKLEDWRWSSFSDYAGQRRGSLCNKDLLMALTGYDLTTFYEDSYLLIGDR